MGKGLGVADPAVTHEGADDGHRRDLLQLQMIGEYSLCQHV